MRGARAGLCPGVGVGHTKGGAPPWPSWIWVPVFLLIAMAQGLQPSLDGGQGDGPSLPSLSQSVTHNESPSKSRSKGQLPHRARVCMCFKLVAFNLLEVL